MATAQPQGLLAVALAAASAPRGRPLPQEDPASGGLQPLRSLLVPSPKPRFWSLLPALQEPSKGQAGEVIGSVVGASGSSET